MDGLTPPTFPKNDISRYLLSKNQKKKDSSEPKLELFDEITYHFRVNISKVFCLIRNFELLIEFNTEHYPVVVTKGSNTFSPGSEFCGMFLGVVPFTGRVDKYENFISFIKLVWVLTTSLDHNIKITAKLYKVTEDDTCVLLWRVKCSPLGDENEFFTTHLKKGLTILTKELCHKIETKLLESKIFLQYESGIIRGKMEDIWEIVTDYNKLNLVVPNNNCMLDVNFKGAKPGQDIKAVSNKGGKKVEYNIHIVINSTIKGWNKWLLVYKTNDKSNFPDQYAAVELIQLDENECYLALINKVLSDIDSEDLKDISERKKYIINELKNYFENFYCPNKDKEENE